MSSNIIQILILALTDLIRPSFPPIISISELVPNTTRKGKIPKRASNEFFIYRKSCIKTMRANGISIPMPKASSIIGILWANELPLVKTEYKRLAQEARDLYNTRYGVIHTANTSDMIMAANTVANTEMDVAFPNTIVNMAYPSTYNISNIVPTITMNIALPDTTIWFTPDSATSFEFNCEQTESEKAEKPSDANLDYEF